jgi:hypothetical protein
MWAFPTLDIRIVSRAQWVLEERDGRYYKCVQSHSILYDKRREKCYDGIPIAQFTHVSSNVGESVGSSIILGQLHRFRELIQVRDNFVYECGLLLAKMQNRGYQIRKLKNKLLHFLRRHPDLCGFGAVNHWPIYNAILYKWDELLPEVVVHQHATAFVILGKGRHATYVFLFCGIVSAFDSRFCFCFGLCICILSFGLLPC